KVYTGSIELGAATDTFDAEGKVLSRYQGPLPSEASVRAALAGFGGEVRQVPPMYSSVKHEGEPLHRIARRGGHVERAPRKVTILRLEGHGYRPPRGDVEGTCSGGAYVRSLAEDLGRELGCGAHLAHLRRTRSGPFLGGQALALAALEQAAERGETESLLLSPL